MNFDLFQCLSAFIVLFAIIDPLGSIPIILSIEQKGIKIKPLVVALWAYVLMLLFFFVGDWILKFFSVGIEEFAAAGAIVLFIMALEMLLDVEIFKNNGPEGTGSIVPLAFPLFAGPGVFTSLLTLRAEYSTINIVLAITLDMCCVFAVLSCTRFISKGLGQAGIYIVRKFFGIILLAIAVKIFAANLGVLFGGALSGVAG